MTNMTYSPVTQLALEQSGVNPGNSAKLLLGLLTCKIGNKRNRLGSDALGILNAPYAYSSFVGDKIRGDSVSDMIGELSLLVRKARREDLTALLIEADHHAKRFHKENITGEDIVYAMSEASPKKYIGSKYLIEKGWTGQRVDVISSAILISSLV